MIAAEQGNSDAVDALLAAGAAIDIRDGAQLTAYGHAFRANHFDVAHKVHYVEKVEVPLTGTAAGKPKIIIFDMPKEAPPQSAPYRRHS